MDNRFEELVLEEIDTNEFVVEYRNAKNELAAQYGNTGECSFGEARLMGEYTYQLEIATRSARHAAEEFWARVKPGAVFLHKRYITSDRQPERCVITKVAYCRHGSADMIFYRTAGGQGLRTKCAPMYFRHESFKEWA